MTSPRLSRALATVTIAFVAMTACSSGEDRPEGLSVSRATPSVSSTEGAATSPNGTTTARASAPSAGEPDGSTPKAGTTLNPRSGRAASQSTPPEAGTYTYRQSGSMTIGDDTSEVPERGTLEVKPATTAKGGLRSEQIRDLGNGSQLESVYLFSDDEVVLQEITTQGFSCVLRPSLLALRIPLKVGQTWSDTATCSTNTMSITINLDAEVLRKEDRTVGSTTVETFVLDLHTETTGAGFEQIQDATTWLSPEHRMAVRTKTRSQTTSPYGNGSSRYTEELVSLIPK